MSVGVIVGADYIVRFSLSPRENRENVESDDFVPSWMVHPLYEVKPGEKYLWIAPGSAHGKAFIDHPEEYRRQVAAFAQEINF